MPTILERLTSRIDIDDRGCWNWRGATNSNGYGCIGAQGKVQLTHRVSYELHVGPISDGLQIDHLCRNRICINPAHLDPVTAAEHAKRSLRARATHCINGHLLEGDNLHLRTRENGQVHRGCKTCRREGKRVAPHEATTPRAWQPRTKITADTAQAIRDDYASGSMSQRAVAARHGVSPTLVNFIVNGKRNHAA